MFSLTVPPPHLRPIADVRVEKFQSTIPPQIQ